MGSSASQAKPRRHIERLHHFACVACGKWWTVGDAPQTKKQWFCPWCGKKNEYRVSRRK